MASRKDHVVLHHKLEVIMSMIIGEGDTVPALIQETEGTEEGVEGKRKKRNLMFPPEVLFLTS